MDDINMILLTRVQCSLYYCHLLGYYWNVLQVAILLPHWFDYNVNTPQQSHASLRLKYTWHTSALLFSQRGKYFTTNCLKLQRSTETSQNVSVCQSLCQYMPVRYDPSGPVSRSFCLSLCLSICKGYADMIFESSLVVQVIVLRGVKFVSRGPYWTIINAPGLFLLYFLERFSLTNSAI